MITITKKLAFVLISLALLFQPAVAQEKSDNRTVTTKIADLLSQLPAKDAVQLKRNMQEVADLGEDGYVTLISGMVAPGKGNNALVEYAVSGFTAAATKNGEWKKLAESAYCKSLGVLTNKQNKAFIISQFDLVGSDAAVPCLAAYLTDGDLADEASRALAKTNTQMAVSSLIDGLAKATGNSKLSIVEALVHTNSKAAAGAIGNLLNSDTDKYLKKAGLYSLAHINDDQSESILLKAAESTGYKYDQTNAVAALLVYEQNKAAANPKHVADVAKEILNKITSSEQVDQRVAALTLIAETSTDQQFLQSALSDKQFEYRAAAIKLAKLDESDSKVWIGKLASAEPHTKVLILDKFGSSDVIGTLPAILKQVQDKDTLVQNAAAGAAVKLGGEAALDNLLKMALTADGRKLEILSAAIMRMKGDGVTAKIATYIPKARPLAQVALINILANRAAGGQAGIIYSSLTSKNPDVRRAAFKALKSISNSDSKSRLYALLMTTSDPADLGAIQDAIIESVKGAENADVRSEDVLKQMGLTPEDKKQLFYKVLGNIGGSKALNAVSEAFSKGNEVSRMAALDALASWADVGATSSLIQIARASRDDATLNQALNGFLRLVRNSSFPPEQRLLQLRSAMEIAKTNAQQLVILKDLEQAKCFNTIMYAGQFLDNPALQQVAANAVMNITLSGEYTGEIIKNLLNKTIAVITGGDAGYQKEGMRKYISSMKAGEGFVNVFNGKDLTGWKGLVADPIKRSKMSAKELADEQVKADAQAKDSWKVLNGELVFQSHGDNLATVKKYGDFEMLVDWKIIDDKKGEGDAGIYLRGTPQVQIWDLARTNVGAQVGSGGLYNNQVNPSKPLVVADNKLDEWNTFRILMKGDRVTVWLNGVLVTDNVVLENYWDRSLPIFAEEQIELQAHGSPVAYRDIYIREIPRSKPYELTAQEKKEGYKILFDGTNMYNWTGNLTDYVIKDGNIAIEPVPGKGSGGNLYTKEEFSDFVYRFEFQLTPGANNGLGIRAPLEGDAAYVGMELQILDNEAPMYKDLHVYQYHGSVYGTIPAKRGFLKPVGEWNYEEVVVKGPKIKVILNGTVILDGDITPFKKNGTPDHQQHPGLLRDSGHIGFLGHGSPVQFRNIRIKDLSKKDSANASEAKKK
ncbi:family 16 glycoside hydrolase [Pedobacter sp. PWIIR3]